MNDENAAIRALIFDRDDVLTYFDREKIRRALSPLLPFSLDGLSQRWKVLWDERGQPATHDEEVDFYGELWDRIAAEVGLSSEQRRGLDELDYTTMLRPFGDSRPALLEARRRGLRVAVLSNSHLARVEAVLRAVGLDDVVEVACNLPLLGLAKPEPDAYRVLVDALGLPPASCLFFDNLEVNVEGARDFGLRAYLVDRGRETHDLARGVVRDLSALASVLDRENDRRVTA